MVYPNFNLEALPRFSSTIIVGKGSSGKSVLLLDQVKRITATREISHVYIINCNPIQNRKFLGLGQKTEKYYSDFSFETLMQISNTQRSLIKENPTVECVLVVDDTHLNKNKFKGFVDCIVRDDLHCTIILLSQSLVDFDWRSLEYFNYCFMAREYSQLQVNTIYRKMLIKSNISCNYFHQRLRDNTKNFNFLLYCKNTNSFFCHNSNNSMPIRNKEHIDSFEYIDWIGYGDDIKVILHCDKKNNTKNKKLCIEV